MFKPLFFSTLFALALSAACSDGPGPVRQPLQRAFLVGPDVSATFVRHDTLNAGELRDICRFVALTGGTVAFRTIGNPSDLDFRRLELEPPPMLAPGAAYSDRKRWRADTAAVGGRNAARTEAFLAACMTELLHRGQPHTDLNGWMSRAAELLSEAGMADREQYAWLWTDGYQSVRRDDGSSDTLTRCELLPAGVTLIVSGWKNPQCRPAGLVAESPKALATTLQQLNFKK